MARQLGFSFANTGACAQAQVHHSLLQVNEFRLPRFHVLADWNSMPVAHGLHCSKLGSLFVGQRERESAFFSTRLVFCFCFCFVLFFLFLFFFFYVACFLSLARLRDIRQAPGEPRRPLSAIQSSNTDSSTATDWNSTGTPISSQGNYQQFFSNSLIIHKEKQRKSLP